VAGVGVALEPGGVLGLAVESAVALRFRLATNSIRARRRRTNSSGEYGEEREGADKAGARSESAAAEGITEEEERELSA